MKRGLHFLAQQGYAPGGFPPRGYSAEFLEVEIEGNQRTVRRGAPDPTYWDLALTAWKMREAGASYDEILRATHLFKHQGCFVPFFANTTYLGIRKCGELEVENAHKPMITQEIWDAVQKRRQLRPSKRKGKSWEDDHPRRARSLYLLSGLLYCSECGAAMCGSYSPERHMKDGHRKEWRFYICGRKTRESLRACSSSRLKADVIESAVLETLLRDVLTVDHIEHIIRETNAALAERRGELKQSERRLRRGISRLDGQISRLIDGLESGESAAVRSRLERRERERDQLHAELLAVKERLQRSRIEISRGALEQLIGDMHAVLKDSDVNARRRLLRAFIVRIEANREGGVLYYTFPFRASSDSDIGSTPLGAFSISLSGDIHQVAFSY